MLDAGTAERKEINMKNNILELARGALSERVEYELVKVVDNILDINTPATKKRKITVTLELEPDEARQMVTITASAKTALVPTMPIKSAFYVDADPNGTPILSELIADNPRQTLIPEIEERSQPVIAVLDKKAE